MNIALIGYGKMGQIIERLATERGHTIVLRITSANGKDIHKLKQKGTDVAIEFTRPESAKNNVLRCLDAGVSVVSGTTGWSEDLAAVKMRAVDSGKSFLHAANFSIGMNFFFEVNKRLASLMNGHPEYKVTIEETHHTQKIDAPSGTAIVLAEQVISNLRSKHVWTLNDLNEPGTLPVIAHRVENVPGTHKVSYTSPIEDIEMIHTAHSRDGFALGAVLAAEYINGKQGVFAMKDVLGIK